MAAYSLYSVHGRTERTSLGLCETTSGIVNNIAYIIINKAIENFFCY